MLREILCEGLCDDEKLGVDLFGGFRRRREVRGGGERIGREGARREERREEEVLTVSVHVLAEECVGLGIRQAERVDGDLRGWW